MTQQAAAGRAPGGVTLEGDETIMRFEVPGLAQYSYLIASEGEAVVVDPARDLDLYTSYVAERGLRITHVTETHIHADFASGTAALAAATGAELAVSGYDQGEIYSYAMPHRSLRDGDVITAGRLRLAALHTPGHTPEHLSFVLFDQARQVGAPVAIFTGDFMFSGSLGRPDLLGEGSKLGLAHELYRTVHHRIAHLPDDVAVYPGHGAGSLCGAGIGHAAQTTFGHERATQYLFRLDEQEFVREILATVPPLPVYYLRMKRLNAAGAAAFDSGGAIPALDAAAIERLRADTVILLDLRPVEAFSAAHVPGAINLGSGASLPLWAGWLLDAERSIVLMDEQGDVEALQEIRRVLARVGLDRVVGLLAGGVRRWIADGGATAAITLLSPAEAAQASHPALLLDVRNRDEWSAGYIGGAENLPLGELPLRIAELPRDQEIVAVCGSGYRASAAASLLQAAGHRVASLHDGMAAWTAASLPVVRGN